MDYKNILISFDGDIGFLTINRPKALNSLNIETLQDIQMGMQEVKNNQSCKVLILTGAGDKAFVAGADIAEMKGMNSLEALNFSKLGHMTLKMIQDLDRPVIAAVNGYALGGGTEIAAACDFIYASENARFGVPEVTLGIFPGFGGDATPPPLGREREGQRTYLHREDGQCPRGLSNGDCESGLSPGLPDGGDKEDGCPDRREWNGGCKAGQNGHRCRFQYGSYRSLFFGILCLQLRFYYGRSEGRDDRLCREKKTQF